MYQLINCVGAKRNVVFINGLSSLHVLKGFMIHLGKEWIVWIITSVVNLMFRSTVDQY